jgi:hypothetical protein
MYIVICFLFKLLNLFRRGPSLDDNCYLVSCNTLMISFHRGRHLMIIIIWFHSNLLNLIQWRPSSDVHCCIGLILFRDDLIRQRQKSGDHGYLDSCNPLMISFDGGRRMMFIFILIFLFFDDLIRRRPSSGVFALSFFYPLMISFEGGSHLIFIVIWILFKPLNLIRRKAVGGRHGKFIVVWILCIRVLW